MASSKMASSNVFSGSRYSVRRKLSEYRCGAVASSAKTVRIFSFMALFLFLRHDRWLRHSGEQPICHENCPLFMRLSLHDRESFLHCFLMFEKEFLSQVALIA